MYGLGEYWMLFLRGFGGTKVESTAFGHLFEHTQPPDPTLASSNSSFDDSAVASHVSDGLFETTSLTGIFMQRKNTSVYGTCKSNNHINESLIPSMPEEKSGN